MLDAVDTLILSPHLDDAVLSCGGLIHQRVQREGKAVLVATFMTGDPPTTAVSPFAQALHDRWELSAAAVFATRRQEDIRACALLGADHLHFPLLDAIYRTHPQTGAYFVTSNETLFGPVDSADAANMISQLNRILAALPPATQILAPLGVGNHVDHQLVKQAAVAQYGWSRLLFYEDYPYARKDGAVEAVIGVDPDWQPMSYSLTDEDLRQKAAAIAEHASQVSSFFNGRLDIDHQIRAYAERVGGERYWFRKTAPIP